MATKNDLSKELFDVIQAIADTRSKQEEDKIILREILSLKNRVKEKNPNLKRLKEMIISAIYIEMLGHDASFCYIQAVNLTQSKSFPLKKIGYLACCLFLNENSEFLLLLVSAIQKDLQSKKEEDVSLALTALGKLLCNMIVFAVSEPVLKLLSHESV